MDRPADIIALKRDGGHLSDAQMQDWIEAFVAGEVTDYQMAAWCMAVFFRGLSDQETQALTRAMVASGDTLHLQEALGRRIVDKHSTGGVGDKTSIVVGPIVAAAGVPFAKMSGRGLGHTGGTLDKLESIPGFRSCLSEEDFVGQVREVGLAIASASSSLVPADHMLYALRDVTATVGSLPLIAASIMSKKIAAGADAVVLDVKVGDGAFARDLTQAHKLALKMQDLGRAAGIKVVCLLTDMDQPLGQTVGNALEVREAAETLRGRGPEDLRELATEIAGRLLSLSDLGITTDEGILRAREALTRGEAYATYLRWIAAQGGDVGAKLPQAAVVLPVLAPTAGYISRLSALKIGQAAQALGAGRTDKEDKIDHSVGIKLLAKVGDRVEKGQPIAEVHAKDEEAARQGARAVKHAYDFATEPVLHRPLIRQIID